MLRQVEERDMQWCVMANGNAHTVAVTQFAYWLDEVDTVLVAHQATALAQWEDRGRAENEDQGGEWDLTARIESAAKHWLQPRYAAAATGYPEARAYADKCWEVVLASARQHMAEILSRGYPGDSGLEARAAIDAECARSFPEQVDEVPAGLGAPAVDSE